jgi:hypothetical protein
METKPVDPVSVAHLERHFRALEYCDFSKVEKLADIGGGFELGLRVLQSSTMAVRARYGPSSEAHFSWSRVPSHNPWQRSAKNLFYR